MRQTHLWTAVAILPAICLFHSGCIDAVDQQSHAQDSVETHDRVAASSSSTSEIELPEVDTNCTVHFTGEVLGGNLDIPISVTTDSINGAMVTLSGNFVGMNDEWIILDSGTNERWIAREHILYMQFAD